MNAPFPRAALAGHGGADSFRARAARVALIAGLHADAVDAAARFPAEAVQALKDERLLSLIIPRGLGGEDADISDIAEICCTLGQHCAASAMIYAMHNIKVSSLVSHGAESPWHREFMARIAAEQLLVASATTEGGIGGDLRNSICAVVVEGDSFTLEKDATVISYGVHADAILVTSRRAPDAAPPDQVMTAVTRDQYTLEKTTGWDTLGMRGTCSEGFKLRARGEARQILPKPFAEIAAQSMLAVSHLLWASLWCGIATNALTRAQSFVRAEARKKPGAMPPGALRVAEGNAKLLRMRADTVDGLRRFARAGRDDDALMSMGFAVAMNSVKLNASRSAVEIIGECLMVCGIFGYKNDTPFSLGRHLRDAHSAAIMISNDRIVSNTSNLLLVNRIETSLHS